MTQRTLTSPLAITTLALLCSAPAVLAQEASPDPDVAGAVPAPARPSRTVAAANNAFGLKVLRELAQPGENLCFSPTSLSMALHMLTQGAGGETRAELERALGVAGLDLSAANRELISSLLQNQDAALSVANSLWLHGYRDLQRRAYALDLARNFRADLRVLDFSQPASVRTINRWVDARTGGKIPCLVSSIPAEQRMLLVNAVALQAEWTLPFVEARTHDAEFRLLDGREVTVPLMHQIATHRALETDDGVVVCLPFGDRGTIGAWIALPAAEGSLHELVSGFDAAALARWNAEAEERECSVFLPRLALANTLQLSEALRELGIERALDRERAELPALEGLSEGTPWVGRVAQRALIRVDETGAEAAAATGILLLSESLYDPTPPLVVRCDRPFLVVIQDFETGSVLFTSTVYRP